MSLRVAFEVSKVNKCLSHSFCFLPVDQDANDSGTTIARCLSAEGRADLKLTL